MKSTHNPSTRIFEHPLSERARLLLRLESLFNQFSYYIESDGPWDSYSAVSTLISLQNLIELSDIKSEVLRELERQSHHLQELHHLPDVDPVKLNAIMQALNAHIKELVNISGRLGQNLRNNDFLSMIRQRLTIPGGTCNFDAPAYNFWLSFSASERKKNLQGWAENFSCLRTAIILILELIRKNSVRSESVSTQKNFYSTALDSPSYQLVQVILKGHDHIFPEISGGRHRVSIRFLTLDPAHRTIQITEDTPFIFQCCS